MHLTEVTGSSLYTLHALILIRGRTVQFLLSTGLFTSPEVSL